jgi:nucleoside 2-deoxyribosyltransferase
MGKSEEYILELIAEGENEKIEFKTRLINQHDIAKVLTAFANTDGGHLFIGVGDNGQIIGLSDSEANIVKDRLTHICSSLSAFPFDIKIVATKGLQIVHAQIFKAPDFLRPVSTSTGEIYIRKNDLTIKSTSETRMFSNGSNKIKPKQEITGFIAMSFRDEEEPALTDYYKAMLRAAEKTKLPIKLTRIDLHEGDFEISQQIMTEIDKADFVIADFTLSPHNVYFEVGYARGVKKRLIQTARKETALQFDVRNWSTLFYRNATELEEKLTVKLTATYKELAK